MVQRGSSPVSSKAGCCSGRPLAFLLGGSSGLDSSVIARATARWSLGPLTFPHELARVILCEQLYRAYTILRGEPYHKGV